MAEIETEYTSEVICPYCGAEQELEGAFPDPYDKEMQVRCDQCDKIFRWTIAPIVYTSWKPTVHDLKIEPKYWLAVYKGEKTFEIRLNDRPFKVGDIVHLHSFFEGGYTHDPVIERQITYITDYAQKQGYVVFGMKPVEED
jgi:DNA-directed RNA polymerase subunit RPC12/RpoP